MECSHLVMFSRRTQSARVSLFFLDQFVLALAFATAYVLKAGWIFADPDTLIPEVYIRLYIVAAPVIALSLSAMGFYRSHDEIQPKARVRKRDMVRGALIATMVLILVGFLVPPATSEGRVAPSYSRVMILLYTSMGTCLLWVSRLTMMAVSGGLRADPDWTTRVVVFGDSPRLHRLLGALDRMVHANLEVVGIAAESAPEDLGPKMSYTEALAVVEQGLVDHVLVDPDDLPSGRLDDVLAVADREGISTHITSAMFPSTHLLPTWERLGGVPVMGFVSAELTLGERIVKRVFDLMLSSIGLAIFSIPMVIIAALIRFESKGAAMFIQDRVGSRGAVFRMFKFRTMNSDAEADTGPVFAVENDARCTRLGRILRRWNLDELPQLINVFLGHMSLVGPRPERPEFVSGFKRSIPRYAHKHWVKPGITGWAQIHGLRGSDTSLEERIEHDLYYIEHWSLLFDIRILMRTVYDGYANAG
jgi:exopolysaccharide biosynthesis polyprenyl glycosylphosphotransferase